MAKTTTKTELTNRALRMIGEASKDLLVDLETDTGQIADVCRQFFEYTVRKVQANYLWDELYTRTILATPADDLTEDPLYPWGWRYDLPADWLAPIWDDATDYEIEGNYLYCDWEENYPLQYRKYSEDPSEWQPQLLIAATHELALAICIPITENETKYAQLLTEYEQVVLPRVERTASVGKRQPNSRYKRQLYSRERGATGWARSRGRSGRPY